MPVAAYHFGSVGWAGLLVNPVAVPVGGVFLLALSLAGALLFPLWPQGAALCWRGCAGTVEWLIAFQDRVVSLAGGSGGSWMPGLPEVAGAYLLLGAVLFLRSARPDRRKGAAALALAGCMGLAGPAAARWAEESCFPRAEAWVFDVGQGASVGMRLPGVGWVLVDGGGLAGGSFDVGAAVVEPALRELGCRRLDLIVSSHPHPDHVGGLPSLTENLHAAEVWLPEVFRGDGRYDPLLAAAERAGSRVRWVDGAGARAGSGLEVFAGRGKGENDRSLLVRMEHGGSALLLPGDIEEQAQKALTAEGIPLDCDVLLAPHHGSAGAVDKSFFASASPRVVVVSCGRRGEFPSGKVLAAATGIGASVRATRDEGCLAVRFDGAADPVEPRPR
jgi:competence protein ComEC